MTATRVCTVTATTGSPFLVDNLLSVNRQSFHDLGPNEVVLHHLVVVDGEQFHARTRDILDRVPAARHIKRSVLWLPENTGKEYVCHRIVAAAAFLVNEPYITFLDEDNEMKEEYVARVSHHIRNHPGCTWGFFLRDIIDELSNYVCDDSCESLGSIAPTFFGSQANDRLVDTNCFVMTTKAAVKFSACWYVRAKQPGVLDGDRRVTQAILAHEHGNHFIIREGLVNYRVCDEDKRLFFQHGNAKMYKHTRYLRTARHLVYVFHFNKQQTHAIFSATNRSPMGEWCMTLLDTLIRDEDVCVLDGFKTNGVFAPGSYVLLNICHPDMLPCGEIRERAGVFGCKVIANMALESPNFRHQTQFQREVLAKFDGLLTFWPHIVKTFPTKAVLMPHNARFFSNESQLANHLVQVGHERPYQVSICLERRDFDETYVIDGQVLRALDFMRERLVRGLRSVVVRGRGWDTVVGMEKGVHLFDGYTGDRQHDTVHPIDVYRRSTFTLIVENCDCPGYVSEKAQDAYMAGSIPLVYNGGHDISTILPRGTYLMINDISSGLELQEFLDTVTDDTIRGMQERIDATRSDYILSRGSVTYMKAVKDCITLLQPTQHGGPPAAQHLSS
jgi:hypothetical protein